MPRASALRLVAIGGVLAFAALALANGFDRASAQRPALAVYVPAPFKAQAWRVESARALEAGDKDDATAAARAAVLADPVDPRSTALLGAAQLAAGERVKADRSFRIAARFGWRDPLTQLYFMNAALNAGEPRLAALRLDAVLRQAPNFPVRDMLLAQFLGSADARAALAERLALRPAWTFAFLNHASQLPLPEQQARAGIVAGMGVEQNREDENGYERTRTVDGAIQTEKWETKRSRGSFGTQVAGRFMIEAEGDAGSIDELKAIVAGIDKAKLESLAK